MHIYSALCVNYNYFAYIILFNPLKNPEVSIIIIFLLHLDKLRHRKVE